MGGSGAGSVALHRLYVLRVPATVRRGSRMGAVETKNMATGNKKASGSEAMAVMRMSAVCPFADSPVAPPHRPSSGPCVDHASAFPTPTWPAGPAQPARSPPSCLRSFSPQPWLCFPSLSVEIPKYQTWQSHEHDYVCEPRSRPSCGSGRRRVPDAAGPWCDCVRRAGDGARVGLAAQGERGS